MNRSTMAETFQWPVLCSGCQSTLRKYDYRKKVKGFVSLMSVFAKVGAH